MRRTVPGWGSDYMSVGGLSANGALIGEDGAISAEVVGKMMVNQIDNTAPMYLTVRMDMGDLVTLIASFKVEGDPDAQKASLTAFPDLREACVIAFPDLIRDVMEQLQRYLADHLGIDDA